MTNKLTKRVFIAINATLSEKGVLLRSGTIIDATIVNTPPSTKNAEHKRDANMHHETKSNQWCFDMKAHASINDEDGDVHSLTMTAANVVDIVKTAAVLHDDDETRFADAGYTGVAKREKMNDIKMK